MKIRLNRTDTPYKITKATMDSGYQPFGNIAIGSTNRVKSKKSFSSKKEMYKSFVLEFLNSFGLLTEGGLVVFAKKLKSSIAYFTVEVLKDNKTKKVNYTFNGVSGSPLSIAIRLEKKGVNAFAYSTLFNRSELIKEEIKSAWFNTAITFYRMMSNCNYINNLRITYIDPKTDKVFPGLLSFKNGTMTFYNGKTKKTFKGKKKIIDWIKEHLLSFDVPSTITYDYKKIKYLSKIARTADISTIRTIKVAYWFDQGMRYDVQKEFLQQKNANVTVRDDFKAVSTTKSAEYFESILKKSKVKPGHVVLIIVS